MPTMPLHTIVTAANTVPRASPALAAAESPITETRSDSSMTVTATARTSGPNGSPMRCATTSAWYTAANTVAITTAPATAVTRLDATKNVSASTTQATSGQVHAHQ